MIEKFLEIKNIGRFKDYTPRGDVSFRKLTLVFAENGRGKSTLCGILRSLQTGQPIFISERKTLGATTLTSVQLRFGGRNINFTNDSWSTTCPDIEIFDSVFVHNNVFAGDYVEHEHKKNLYRIIIGARGVELARQIEKLDANIREANNNIRTKADFASKTLPSTSTLEEYLKWEPIEDIEAKIQQKDSEIVHCQRTLEKLAEIESKNLLEKLELPSFPSGFSTILSKQLMDLSTNAEALVRQQIDSFSRKDQGEEWISQGLDFIEEDKCPFCGQIINENTLIAAYRSYFNVAYMDLKQEIKRLSERISIAIGDPSLDSAQQAISSNLILVEFWKQFIEISLPSFDFNDIRSKYRILRDLSLSLAQQKQKSPMEPITLGEDFQVALDAVTAIQESVEAYNIAADKVNALIDGQKAVAQQGTDIIVLKTELANFKANRNRFEPEVVQACKNYEDAEKAKADLEQQKSDIKEQLDQHCQQILQTYQSSINTYLDQFNAGFRITNSRHLYTGGTPSSYYQIEINNNSIDLGDSRTLGIPCFKTALSSGDRSALALAFFLAAIRQDSTLGNKIVILDDPFTSQDRFRRTCTQQLIRQVACSAKQVVVFSHDPHFLKLIWENYPPNDIKVLQLYSTGDNTVIGEWDIEAETQSTYRKNYSVLLDFYRERKGELLDVARSIRPFLEGLLRSHFPGHFKESEWLGDFITKIRNATNTGGLSHAKADLAEIEAINDYSKKYHHEQNPNANSESVSEDELHGFVKRTLRLVGGC